MAHVHGSPKNEIGAKKQQVIMTQHARQTPSRVENNIHHMPNVVKQSTTVSIHVGTLWHEMKKYLLMYWKLCSIILVASRYMFTTTFFLLDEQPGSSPQGAAWVF